MKINPVVFSLDTDFYKNFENIYKKHDYGLFILAPSGAGKTHFCKSQVEKHWIDGDDLWMAAKAHPDGPWWEESLEVMNRVDQRSDVITMEAKHEGFWIMGASNNWLKPDAIVIPDWEKHKQYIEHRQKTNYDGGATMERLSQVQSHIEWIKKWHTDHGVPLFESIDEAVQSLTRG